jgi:hypothetical protein
MKPIDVFRTHYHVAIQNEMFLQFVKRFLLDFARAVKIVV